MKILLTVLLLVSSIFSNYNDFNQAFINVAKNQSETIVSIISTKTEKMNNMFFFNPFDDFDFGQDPFQQEREAQSLGSGVIIDNEQGYIITNNHVIANADDIIVRVNNKEYEAKVIGSDPYSDIAVLKIETSGSRGSTINVLPRYMSVLDSLAAPRRIVLHRLPERMTLHCSYLICRDVTLPRAALLLCVGVGFRHIVSTLGDSWC